MSTVRIRQRKYYALTDAMCYSIFITHLPAPTGRYVVNRRCHVRASDVTCLFGHTASGAYTDSVPSGPCCGLKEVGGKHAAKCLKFPKNANSIKAMTFGAVLFRRGVHRLHDLDSIWAWQLSFAEK